jgi:serine/threonine protein kinase
MSEWPKDPNEAEAACGITKVIRLLGEGAEGTVTSVLYKGQVYALKVSKTGNSPWKEIAVGKAIDSPHVLRINYLLGGEIQCNPPGIPILTRVGDAVEDILQVQAFNLERQKKATEDLLKGLNVLHMNGIIHGDIKPGNMIVVESNKTDFYTIADFDGVTFSKTYNMNTQGIYSVNSAITFAFSDLNRCFQTVERLSGRSFGFVVDTSMDIYSLGLSLICIWSNQPLLNLFANPKTYQEPGIETRFHTELVKLYESGLNPVTQGENVFDEYKTYTFVPSASIAEFFDRAFTGTVEMVIVAKILFIRLMTDDNGSMRNMISRLINPNAGERILNLLDDMTRTNSKIQIWDLLDNVPPTIDIHYRSNKPETKIAYAAITAKWFSVKCPNAQVEHQFAVADRFCRSLQRARMEEYNGMIPKFYAATSPKDLDLDLFLLIGCLYLETVFTPEYNFIKEGDISILEAVNDVYGSNIVNIDSTFVERAAKCVTFLLDGKIYANPYFDSLDNQSVRKEMDEMKVIGDSYTYLYKVLKDNMGIDRDKNSFTFFDNYGNV